MTLTVPAAAIGAAIPGRPLFTLAGVGLAQAGAGIFG